MKKVKCISGIFLMLAMVVMTSCMSVQKLPKTVQVPLVVSSQSVPTTYRNLEKTVRLNVTSTGAEDVMYDDSNLPERVRRILPQYIFVPSVREFAADATTSYMQRMCFGVTPNGDFRFDVDVKTFKMKWIDETSVECEIVINYKLLDGAGQTVVASSTASSRITLASAEQFGNGLGRAYAEALNNVNWDRIAKCLMVANTPKQEANVQVAGAGDTALEHTVIRWYITSTPQGADVSWRVVSSTPDVANTNSNFVGSTPYETTESFDIKGMTYNNSGNIQIEISCEKSGYITQRKRFNLRQAIDQKEISAKFNLIKDE
ncbi:MAG: hypothetical protein K2N13_01975 [Paraprevotella sp.]|nr:hypothetical protein [Paraprevotella sp.]